ncbi:hypothetical protein [Allohahella sp. A8]|uniref:hypothetical protein n=1 Tax=Allohahella sp. A8 TaxID=3141461 RepID=UPI003A80C5AA
MSLDDTTGCCMLCEQHSREAQAARAEVLALKRELLEPQAVRVAPDYPEAGQYFWLKTESEPLLCLATERYKESILYSAALEAYEGYYTMMEDTARWIPVSPPTFPKEGL